MQLVSYRLRKDMGNGGFCISGWFDAVSMVLSDICFVQVFDPVGFLVDERVDFLCMNDLMCN